MPIIGNIRENLFFHEVFEEGKHECHQESRQEEAVALLCRQLEHRFGPIPAATRQQIEAADTSKLETWSLRVLRRPWMKCDAPPDMLACACSGYRQVLCPLSRSPVPDKSDR